MRHNEENVLFDPFNDRLCRDVRNALSEGFVDALNAGDIRPVNDAVHQLAPQELPPHVRVYIEDRAGRYAEVLEQVAAKGLSLDDTLEIARLVWNRALFFEFHEWLEPAWKTAVGMQKTMLQALIRSAGLFVLLESGRERGAARTLPKVVAKLNACRNHLPAFVDVDRLIEKMTSFDGLPPIFDSYEPGDPIEKDGDQATNGEKRGKGYA
ncbi:MAG: DUF309 domain-containing protein [Deltaproteobacteria bacterium]|nr:DUF309 domain-containing protein [Deltaproteobacteria bacterium]